MKKVIVLALVATLGFVGWKKLSSGDEASPPKNDLVVNRLWIDHMPRGERDLFNILAFIDEDSVGVFQKMSVWVGEYEGFRYEANDGEIRIVYPQTGNRETIRARARTCNEAGMDFCLEISGSSHGVKKYYSQKGWEIDSTSAVEKLAKTVANGS